MIRVVSGLILVAVAAWLSVVIADGAEAAETAAPNAPQKDAPYPGLKYRMPEIMLISWAEWPAKPEHQDTLAKFIKEKGFNAVETTMESLDTLRRNGMYARLGTELAAAPKLKDDPAVFCYFISDRRRSDAFPKFAHFTREYEKADPNHPTMFINRALWNQFPAFVEVVKPNLLTYYHYQWRSGQHQERNLLYLGMFRDLAVKNDIPLLRCTDARATPAQIRHEHFTSLAYGVKGFHYSPCHHFGYKKNEQGPILENGQIVPTLNEFFIPLSDIAKEIKTLSPVLVKLKSVDVFHTDPLPLGGKKPPQDSWIGLSGEQIFTGVLKNDEGRDYLLPVNNDAAAAHEATLRLKSDVIAVKRMDKKSGQWTPLELKKDGDGGVVKLTLAPGDGELLKIVRSAGQ